MLFDFFCLVCVCVFFGGWQPGHRATGPSGPSGPPNGQSAHRASRASRATAPTEPPGHRTTGPGGPAGPTGPPGQPGRPFQPRHPPLHLQRCANDDEGLGFCFKIVVGPAQQHHPKQKREIQKIPCLSRVLGHLGGQVCQKNMQTGKKQKQKIKEQPFILSSPFCLFVFSPLLVFFLFCFFLLPFFLLLLRLN